MANNKEEKRQAGTNINWLACIYDAHHSNLYRMVVCDN